MPPYILYGAKYIDLVPLGPVSGLGRTYTCPVGAYATTPCYNYLAGSVYFNIEDYEVFVVSTTTNAMQSKITTSSDTQSITTWVQAAVAAFKNKALTFKRCYSMKESGDGGTVAGFHKACDGKGPTVTVVKAKGGAVFGGFADKAWSSPSPGTYVASDTAFLFCLACGGDTAKAKGAHQLKLNDKDNQKAMHHDAAHGPTFGGGHDLHIGSQPGSTSKVSYANLGNAYTCSAGAYGSTACNNYLAGMLKFTVEDYEVFFVSAA